MFSFTVASLNLPGTTCSTPLPRRTLLPARLRKKFLRVLGRQSRTGSQFRPGHVRLHHATCRRRRRRLRFSHFTSVTDIGGGNGALLTQLLNAYPKLRGIVFDQPQVIERTSERLRRLGLSDRLSAIGGNFFESIPEGADAYTIKHVIHDWKDEDARAILQTCCRAMRPDAKLLIIEGVYPPHIDQSEASRSSVGSDVNMLVCTGGRTRTEHEFQSLLASAGFRLTRIIPTLARIAIIESSPA